VKISQFNIVSCTILLRDTWVKSLFHDWGVYRLSV
jgi:hypothetical protein